MRRPHLLIIGVALVVIGFLGVSFLGYQGWYWMYGPMGSMMGPPIPSHFKSNGERIYYNATSDSGDSITFTGGPIWLYMHGGSCANCHGPDGRGGYLIPMTDVSAPDIRYSTLTSKEPMGQGHEEHPPYTAVTIKRAITEGLDPAGHPLNRVMPRWTMSDRDLNDLIDYLKTL